MIWVSVVGAYLVIIEGEDMGARRNTYLHPGVEETLRLPCDRFPIQGLHGYGACDVERAELFRRHIAGVGDDGCRGEHAGAAGKHEGSAKQ